MRFFCGCINQIVLSNSRLPPWKYKRLQKKKRSQTVRTQGSSVCRPSPKSSEEPKIRTHFSWIHTISLAIKNAACRQKKRHVFSSWTVRLWLVLLIPPAWFQWRNSRLSGTAHRYSNRFKVHYFFPRHSRDRPRQCIVQTGRTKNVQWEAGPRGKGSTRDVSGLVRAGIGTGRTRFDQQAILPFPYSIPPGNENEVPVPGSYISATVIQFPVQCQRKLDNVGRAQTVMIVDDCRW